MTINSSLFSSDKHNWETPEQLFDLLNDEFWFTVDVCASAANAKCEKYFTEEMDALKQEWTGRCWMNPPYGRALKHWMKKAYESSQTTADVVVCLVPARTDTAWWHDWAAKGEVRFIRGRVRFVGAASGAPFPSALVIFRRKWWENA